MLEDWLLLYPLHPSETLVVSTETDTVCASQCMTVNATPVYICRQIGNLWEAISNIMQSVGFSSPLKILIQKQLALTSWAGLLSGVYFHLCKPYRGEFREVQSLQFSPSIYCMLFSHLVCQ